MPAGTFAKSLLLSLLSFVAASLLFVSGLLDPFELKAYDFFSRHLSPAALSNSIVIVAVDQQSVDALAKQDVLWPWPRQVYAPIIEYLSEADAIFIDILFTEHSSYGMEDDRIFSAAIKKAANVYLPVFLREKGSLTAYEKQIAAKIGLPDKLPAFGSYCSMLLPIDLLSIGAAGHGNVMIKPDGDGIYRSVPLVFQTTEFSIPHFVLPYLLRQKLVTILDRDVYAGDRKVPLSGNTLLLRYSLHPEPFKVLSAADIIQSSLDSSSGKQPALKKAFFKGKKIFIGLTAAGLLDLKPTAITAVSTGVHIHATTLENLINKNFIAPLGMLPTELFMFFLSLSVVVFVLRYHSLSISLGILLFSLIFSLLVPAILFRNSYYLNAIPPLLSAMLSFAIATAYSYAVEGKQRRFIKKTFSQYMDRTLVEHVLQHPEVIQPGGHQQRVTVFFADIAGFTTLAERISPEEVALVLHNIFNEFTEVIIKNRGVIDKYIGDCVMAFWGAPLSSGCDETDACHAALQCMDALRGLNQSFISQDLPEISMRIGIHTGTAIVGNLGSDRLFDYTVVGDTVNLASRLESINKIFRTRIIVSEETMSATGDAFFFRELGLIEVKGKSKSVRIFELKGNRDDSDAAEMQRNISRFHEGLDCFRRQEWIKAEEIFSRAADDGPSAFYRPRCEVLASTDTLTEGWDIIKMTEK
jgi:adenylate cyclase